MQKWQVQSKSGLLVRIVEALTPREAVRKWQIANCPHGGEALADDLLNGGYLNYTVHADGIHIIVD